MDSHDPIDDQVVLAETTENDGSVEIDGPIQTNGPIQINRPVIDDRSLNRDQLAGLDAAADLDDVVDLVVDDNLAVDDSEYGDDDDDLIDDDDDETPDGAFHGDDDHASFLPIAVIGLGIDDHSTPAALRPLASAELPESVYMLVDKTVELQARPLREISELGPLPPEEHPGDRAHGPLPVGPGNQPGGDRRGPLFIARELILAAWGQQGHGAATTDHPQHHRHSNEEATG